MDIGKNKFKSIIKQVQNSAEILANKNIRNKPDRRSSVSSSNCNISATQLDLPSAIEYNYCLINSYLQERNQRKLSPHEEILKTLDGDGEEHDEESIIDSISQEFFLDPKSLENSAKENNNDESDPKNCDVLSENFDFRIENIIDKNENGHLDGQSKILEMCVLNKLPDFSEADRFLCDEFLNYIENEKKKLNKQQTVVSKKLTEMILKNDGQFKHELERVRLIETDLSNAVHICSEGRKSFQVSKKNFTETSINIIENYRRREAIVQIIDSSQNIKKLRQTIDHIEYMLQYEKNFSSAINLFDEKFEILEAMSKKYLCVAIMKEKLMQTLQLVDDQMDTVLAKMTERFCLETFGQLCKAYSQIGKSESSINQLLLHFTNVIHDKAFSIVLGYVKLFNPDHLVLLSSSLGPAHASSTPIKLNNSFNNKNKTNEPSIEGNNTNDISQECDLKRKPFNELCQYLNPESFLQCLTDLCRALWDLMNNYHQILCFFRKEDLRSNANLTEDEVKFAIDKLNHGVLRVWSDVQHKIRTLVSSVKFVQTQDVGTIDGLNDSMMVGHHQDQLLFNFEEFIKILTVCERMIEIGEQFCELYHQNDDSFDGANLMEPTVEFQQTLFQQTRAYFQSYHRVSMCEMKIFLENEIWTRCPIETRDEFELIANLQEYSFIKNRLLKIKSTKALENENCYNQDDLRERNKANQKSIVGSNSYLLSPVTKAKKYFNVSYFQDNDIGVVEEVTPFDGIITRIVSQQTFDDSDDSGDDGKYIKRSSIDDQSSSNDLEIVTTNATLNVLRLIGRYMNIMFLLRPISHDIIKALLELFDYYFYTVYHFFTTDKLNASWLDQPDLSMNMPLSDSTPEIDSSVADNADNNDGNHQPQSSRLILSHFSSFIRRINDTLILNETSPTHHHQTPSTNEQSPSRNKGAKKTTKHPCPTLPEYVSIGSGANQYALGERIIAIQSLIFITRQFYNLCPFLLEFLRFDDDRQPMQPNDSISPHQQSVWENRRKSVEEGFKLLQFYYDKMCSSVESLLYQCLYAVSSKLLPYEMIIQKMSQTKWDLKEIPSMHSEYVNVFVNELYQFDPKYRRLLESNDLVFLIPDENNEQHPSFMTNNSNMEDMDEMPLMKLSALTKRMNFILWQCILKISNRTFVEGFSSVKKCTNEGRALMQLDYEQFLSHIEKLMMPYFKAATINSSSGDNFNNNSNNNSDNTGNNPQTTIRPTLKSYLANERLYVEEFVKAFYITETTFIEWIKQRPDYTTKQIVSLINCITADNKKLRSVLLAAIDTTPSSNMTMSNDSNLSTPVNAMMVNSNNYNSNINHYN